MPDWSYRTVFQPLLFRLPFETGRDLALGAMGRLSRFPLGSVVIDLMGHMRPVSELSRTVLGETFPAPVGIGCAIDPHGAATQAMARFGAGFIEVGPVASERLEGRKAVERRDSSRAIRLPKEPASDGLQVWCERLAGERPLGVKCLARLVVARGTPPQQAADECRTMIDRLRKHVDGFVVATSDEALHAEWSREEWQAHVAGLVECLASAEHSTSLWLVLRADLDRDQIGFLVDAASEAGCRGVLVDARVSSPDDGWLIGQVAFEQVKVTVMALRERGNDELSIIAGGVHEPADALDLLAAGANLVLVDTGLVYSGPGLLKRINEAVLFAERARSEKCPLVVDAASIRTDAGSVGHDCYSRADPNGSRPALGITRWTWFWTLLLGLGLLFGGLLALGIASTRVILPYDEVFVGMSREEMNLISPRLLAFMQHDRVTLSGTMLAVAVLYLSLSWHGIRNGSHWAMMSVLVSALVGFVSFFLFLGFGYFDPFHAFVTAIMFQFLLMAWHSNLGPMKFTAFPNLREDRAWRLAQWGQLTFVIHGAVLIVAGAVICGVGCTTVFVQEDLEFMEVCPGDLSLANPRLIPLIAHDRASFGGMLISTGVTVLLTSLWGLRQGARWQWWMLLLAGAPAYGLAIGVHLAVGYMSGWHLAPAFGGLAALLVGLVLLWPFVGRRSSDLEREWAARLSSG
ncbi:MAG: dihydroorotate dehydrogenase [Planctomycetota bacterium]